ncbi:MAG: S8 family serine peptidase, partial [Cytophagales bacterium]|nr:S8 family serine peptidase [Cytophagales bacterium]
MKNYCSKPGYQRQYLRAQKTGSRIWSVPTKPGGLCKIALLCCLFLLPNYSNAQVKQSSGKYELLLKSASVMPEENLRDFINEPDIKAGEKFEGRYFKFIQFYEIPNRDDREEIESMGIQLLNYIPHNTYAASIPENFDPGSLQELNVRSVISIEADYKIDNRLKTLPYPDWALYGDNSIDIVVQYYKNIDPTKAKKLLIERGIKIISAYDYLYLVTIRVNISEIESIASLPFISWVEPIASPSVPDDTKGRTLHRANVLDSDHALGRHYDGTGVSCALGDDGPIGPHIDYQGRVDQSNTTANTGNHGDMTSGIMMGAGNIDPTIKGMAAGAFLYVYDISGYNHILDAPSNLTNFGVVITSTSYSQGCNAGYTTNASSGDQMIRQNPSLIHVFSGGNSGNSDCGYGAGTGWGNITGGYKQGKNVIACGNLNDKDALVSSSSRGPADDGRIKPDICANGVGQLSTDDPNTYQVGGGTSAAAPGIAGVLAQLYQAYRELNSGADPESPLLKACLLNTAEDLGNPGPDFSFGWGRVNAFRAVKTLEDNRYLDSAISQGGANTHNLTVPAGAKQLRVMLYWLDYEGAPAAAKALVNDLNMQVTDPSAVVYDPWVLDPTPNPVNLNLNAVRAVDDLNNMEQVTIDNPPAGSYTITVNGFQVPQGPQKYYIVYEFPDDDVTLTYPIGGEGFVPGETELLRWDAYGSILTFLLEYSINNGASWITIGSVSAAQRYYDWTVPGVLTGEALVRVTRGAFSDVSDTTFSIIGVPQNLAIDWACPDTIQLNWDTVTGATGYEISMLGSMYMDSIGTTSADSIVVYGINPLLEYWFSVKALAPANARGRRAIAIQKNPGTFNCAIPIDAALTEIINPTGGTLQGCQDYSSVTVSIRLNNYGIDTISTIPLHYQVNGGPVVNDTFPDTLAPGSSAVHNFLSAENFSVPGNYNISAWADYPSDGNAYNDTSKTMIEVVTGTLVGLPWSEDFETFALCATTADCEITTCNLVNGWINDVNLVFDDIEWRTDDGGTFSSNTGPTIDHAPGTSTGNYLYLEASGSCNTRSAHLITPCIDLTAATLPELSFWYHMYGADMGELHVDILQGGTWSNDIMIPVSGDQGDSWKEAKVNLVPYTGQIINIRFRGITGSGYQSDMAIDDISIIESTLAPVADFVADKTFICSGETVIFSDLSVNVPNAWSWVISPGTINFVNGTSANSQNPQVEFVTTGAYDVTLIVINTFGNDTLTRSSYIKAGIGPSSAFVEDFESFEPCATSFSCSQNIICDLSKGWVNEENLVIDDLDWRVDEGGTASSNTGPSTDHAPGTISGNYIYVEASGTAGCNENKTALLVTPCIDLSGSVQPQLSFWYHMYGASMGELHLDILDSGIWTNDIMIPLIGNKGNSWQQALVDLTVYTGQMTNLRFRGITGLGITSDMAIDDIVIFEGQAPPIPNFIADNTNTCIGKTVTFTDVSLNAPNSWSWSFSPGTVNFVNATTANSQNPQVQFTASGFYDVTLTTSNAYGSNPVTKTSYIIVDIGATIPFAEGFESGIFPPVEWNIVDPGGSRTWDVRTNVTGSDGAFTTTAYINNFSYNNTGAEDELIIEPVDLTGMSSAMMTFDIAYAAYSSTLFDGLRIDISTDCGVTYTPTGYNKFGPALETAPPTTSSWFPSGPSEWRNDTVDLSAYINTIVRIKFVNINGYGNNLFIDNVNLDLPSLFVSISSPAGATCNGGCDGWAVATVTGDFPPYTYLWNDSLAQTNDTATGLCPGVYSVMVVDSISDTVSATVTISEPAALSGIISTTLESCAGCNDGTISVVASGESGNYTYLWDDPANQTTATADSLTAGVYSVTVTDTVCGTSIVLTDTIEVAPLSLSISTSADATCNGGCDGWAVASVTGGFPPYTYLWDDSTAQTNDTATGLCAGVYSVEVMDTTSDTLSAMVIIAEPAALSGIISTTLESCAGCNDGTISVVASGESGNYTYLWDDPANQSTATADSLTAGVYSVTITDTVCGTSIVLTDTIEVAPLSVSISSSAGATCNGGCDGWAVVTVSGGFPPYTYLWNDSLVLTNDTATDLCAGVNLVAVIDTTSDTLSATVTIAQPAALSGIISTTLESCAGCNDGSISVTVSGESGNYTYLWDDPANQSTATADSLT